MSHTRLTLEELRGLPPGTTIEESAGYGGAYSVDPFGVFVSRGGDHMLGPENFVDWRVISLGTGFRRAETFDQFKQRLAVVSRASAHQHSVSINPVNDALATLGCPSGRPAGPGDWVSRYDAGYGGGFTIPTSAGILLGDPTNWDHFGVFDSDWGHVMGGRTSAYHGMVDGPNIPLGTDADAERIRALKAQVWTVGYRAKNSHSWCGAFENTMRVLGITAESAVGVTAPVVPEVTTTTPGISTHYGEIVDRAHGVPDLPQGTLIKYLGDVWTGAWNIVVRDDNYTHHTRTNIWHTRHLCGPNSGNFGGNGTILFNPADGPMRIPVTSVAMLDALPAGTQLRLNTHSLSTKETEGTWGRARHRTAQEVFDNYGPVVCFIPNMPSFD